MYICECVCEKKIKRQRRRWQKRDRENREKQFGKPLQSKKWNNLSTLQHPKQAGFSLFSISMQPPSHKQLPEYYSLVARPVKNETLVEFCTPIETFKYFFSHGGETYKSSSCNGPKTIFFSKVLYI